MTNYDQHGLMLRNRRNVLEYIARHEEVSRQEIAEALGSSMTTVLAITDFLAEKGFLSVEGQIKTAKGRRPQLLRFVPNAAKAIAVDYDARVARVALCNYYGDELTYLKTSVSNDIRLFLGQELPALVERILGNDHNVLGIGISMPGVFSPNGDSTVFGAASPFIGIEDFKQLKDEFSQKVGLPVYCYNDGNAAAWGEFLKRGRVDNDLVFIQVADGLGAGLILDGKLRSGNRYAAGEIGYMVADPRFSTKVNRPGWFEDMLSRSGRSVEQSIEMVSLAIANVCNVLDVGLFVINAERFDDAGIDVCSAINGKVNALSINPVVVQRPKCQHSSLSGAASLVIQSRLASVLS